MELMNINEFEKLNEKVQKLKKLKVFVNEASRRIKDEGFLKVSLFYKGDEERSVILSENDALSIVDAIEEQQINLEMELYNEYDIVP